MIMTEAIEPQDPSTIPYKKLLILSMMFLFLIVSVLLSIGLGATTISLSQMFDALFVEG